jgi:predicted metalloendopeptidase
MPGGAQTKVSDIIVRQPDYVKAVDQLIADTPVETWKEYL